MGTAAASPPMSKPVTATTALIGVDSPTASLLRDCFRQFGISTVVLERKDARRLTREKFEACVLALDEHAGEVLELARTSASNSRIVVYGIAAGPQDAMRWARYGINVVLDAPVDRQNALRVVRATHLLVLHELRRYVRVPVVSKVTIETGKATVVGSTVEVSAGGMSVRGAGLELNNDVTVTFDLPGHLGITTRGKVCWVRAQDEMIGIRFDVSDSRRLRVKDWIEEYLEF